MATTNILPELFNELRLSAAFMEPIPLPDGRSAPGVARGERRRQKRKSCEGGGTLHWRDPRTGRGAAPVVARDVTETGLQLETPLRVPVGSIVRLSGRTLECIGTTRYCRRVGEKYHVGITLDFPPYPKEERRLHQLRLASLLKILTP